jgi:DNA repair protein RecO
MNITDEAWPLQDPHPEMFSLLLLTLSELEKENSESLLRGVIRAFELRTLAFLGIHPALGTCPLCNQETGSPILFRIRDLKLSCASCLKKSGHSAGYVRLTESFLSFYAQCTDLSTPLPLKELDNRTERLARFFFRRIFINFLGHHLNVLEVTHSMRRDKHD